jgi:Coenzyme PQQ synthesis protein D (PqqD)
MSYKPEVRLVEMTMQEVGDELVVYDSRHRRAHRLNETAALVFRFSDGTRTVEDIAFLLTDDLSLAERMALVWVTLDELSRANMLTAAVSPPDDLNRSRRNLIQKAAAIGLAFPVFDSILAPSPVEAATILISIGKSF